jgi:DNA-binding transcriptional regulator YdaS (Cro superfamily)
MATSRTRDGGLRAAIAAVGSVSELARRLDLSQPTVSAWRRVPSHRIVQVEAVTGVSRLILRPDLYDFEASGRAGEEHGAELPDNVSNFELTGDRSAAK